MKVLISINAFKGAIQSIEATDIVGLSFEEAGFDVEKCYIADGGDGSVDVCESMGARLELVDTYDPLMRPIKAPIAWFDAVAMVEMAKASGLVLLAHQERNPLLTTTFGTGLLLKYAIEHGAKKIILGIGGSATVDGGVGMLAALGFKFLDAKGNPAWMGGKVLQSIKSIELSSLKIPEILIASDVTNPLLGEFGAARIFGPQKGASSDDIEILEEGLKHFHNITKKRLNIDVSELPGAGAAGGIGAFAKAYLSATLVPGAELFMDLGNFNDKAKDACILITGEGALDAQTAHGKAPYRVAKRFKSINENAIVIAFAGNVSSRESFKNAIDVSLAIANKPLNIRDSIEQTKELLKGLSTEIATLLKWQCRSK